MALSEGNAADRTSTEARARFSEAAERLAVRPRWSSALHSSARVQFDEGGPPAIEDDGKSLNGHRAGPRQCTMRERVEALGGRFEIRCDDGAGTRVAARVPEHSVGAGHGDSSLSR